MNRNLRNGLQGRALAALVATLLLVGVLSCTYMKMKPPPDVDKYLTPDCDPDPDLDNSCWMATASNMLAGAGYGTGSSVQARADEIYGEMVTEYGICDGGWTDAALSWWLGSANNTWTGNPYTIVTVYGNKSPKYPWANANGARDIGNELRACQMVGLSISWPTFGTSIGSGGHAIACWGDNVKGDKPISGNPGQVRVVDSDRDADDVTAYKYDSYTSPNPGGPNEGNGWYINYDSNHPYIKHIVTLCPTDSGTHGQPSVQRVVGSFRIHQGSRVDATDLHYVVGTDVEILTYKTTNSWTSAVDPQIVEQGNPRKSLKVDWDFRKTPIPYCKWVTITTEFILPRWNAITYRDVHFTYPEPKIEKIIPHLGWKIITPDVPRATSIPNVTGGYVIGSFDLLRAADTVAQYRFIHQYSFDQTPEMHTFELVGENGLVATNLRFGHSYGLPVSEELWRFSDWMTEMRDTVVLGEEQKAIEIDWRGRLPYPEGEDIKGRIPDIKPQHDIKR